MQFIHSKDIYNITRDILKCIDPRIINHGARTSYILSKMLEYQGKYEMYEIAEFAYIATIHDLGALKTDDGGDVLQYETKNVMPHSIYGYLYLSYLTPFKDRAKLILYHHTDFSQVPKEQYEFMDVVHMLNLAEKVDLYSNILGSKFTPTMFQKESGSRFAPKALDYLYGADKKFHIFDKLASGEYKQELNDIYEYLIFTNEEKHDILLGLLCGVGFRSEYTLKDIITCTQLCAKIGEMMLPGEKEKQQILYYAAALHDIGMSAVSKEIIEAPRKLTDEEMQTLRTHVNVAESILKGRVDDRILEVVMAHHERADGSGYPNRLKDSSMNRLQRILQVADTITGLTSPRSYRDPKPDTVVKAILQEEADKGKLSREVVRVVITHYDTIMTSVRAQSDEMLMMYRKLHENYEKIANAHPKQ